MVATPLDSSATGFRVYRQAKGDGERDAIENLFRRAPPIAALLLCRGLGRSFPRGAERLC